MQWTKSKKRRLYLWRYFCNSAVFFTLTAYRNVIKFHIQKQFQGFRSEVNGLKEGEPLLLLICHFVLEYLLESLNKMWRIEI